MKTMYRFFIYGLMGICMEIFWTGLESLLQQNYTLRGTTYIWMVMIYGLGIFLEPIQDQLRHFNLFIRGTIYMVLIFIGEYLSGSLLQHIIGSCPWNYTDALSVHGLITLSFVPVWFIVGLIFEKIHFILDTIHFQLEPEFQKIKITHFISRKKQL
ncbi:MAG: putative ABC transporter permease [Eubacteriales bacterium]